MKLAFFAALLMGTSAFAEEHSVSAQNFEESVNAAISKALPGDVILMPAGRFKMLNELIIDKPRITLKGSASDKTILDFSEQKAGAQGVYSTANNLVLSDFTIEDTIGNGVKILGVNGLRMQRLRVGWRDSKTSNGAYGVYPVLSQNILIEDCEVYGASDAGIYVGQSDKIIVRGNHVHRNVAGIEIENSTNADVYKNRAIGNTVGILVFDLPDLIVHEGRYTRVFQNDVVGNNLGNYSTKGSIINLVPSGMGIFLLAAKQVEVFENKVLDQKLTGIAMGNYYSTGRKIKDKRYDPMPSGIFIHKNTITRSSWLPNDLNQFTIAMKLILGLNTPGIVYDGVDDGTYGGVKPVGEKRICIHANVRPDGTPVEFGNLHLDNQRKGFPFPGGPGTRDIATHFCTHSSLKNVELPSLGAPERMDPQPSEQDIASVCKASLRAGQINRRAFEYDCPSLQDYGLFADARDARLAANENGFIYELNNQLFTDYASKARFVFLPAGQSMRFEPSNVFELPVGTLVTKTFSLKLKDSGGVSSQQIETRLLIHRKSGWIARVYVWKNGVAELSHGGKVLSTVSYPEEHPSGLKVDYQVPTTRQCATCHAFADKLQPIGLKARFLNWSGEKGSENQLVRWTRNGLLRGMPSELSKVESSVSWQDPSLDLEKRVNGYLDINCAHCHNPIGNARNTGMFLGSEYASDRYVYGLCKTPVAAGIGSGGNKFAIQPGSAKESILSYRMSHSHLAVKMPQLGRSVTHKEAYDMIVNWIDSMPPEKCMR